MLGIVQIVLTVIAWRRGWGLKSLIPMAGAFGFGLLFGALGSEIGIGLGTIFAVLLAADIMTVGVLSAMVARVSRRKAELPAQADPLLVAV